MTQVIFHSSAGFGEYAERKVLVFDGGAGSGAVGANTLFTVTGAIHVMLVAACIESLTEALATATVEVGISSDTAGLIPQTNAVDIDVGEIWRDATPSGMEVMSSFGGAFIGDGEDIILTVAGGAGRNVNDGTISFTCFWTPLTPDGSVVAA